MSVIYNAATHSIERSDGQRLAALDPEITAAEGFRIADLWEAPALEEGKTWLVTGEDITKMESAGIDAMDLISSVADEADQLKKSCLLVDARNAIQSILDTISEL